MKLAAALTVSLLLPIAAMAAEDVRPTREQFEAPVKARMGQLLKDPYSAVWASTDELRRVDLDVGFSKRVVGWGGCYTINAKNDYGGYTGAERYFFVVQDNGGVFFLDRHAPDDLMAEIFERECPAQR